MSVAASILLAALGGTDASAQYGTGAADLTGLSIEQLMSIKVATVYGASKYEQQVGEAPAVVSVVTSEDIRHYGYRTLADILRSVRGFYVTYDRNYSFVGARGLGRPGDYNARVLLLLNGYRINDNIYDQAYIGTDFLVDVDLIDRVEVIRGPGSSIYGGNAFLGVINVITKTGKDLNGVEASAAGASFHTTQGRLTYGKKFDNGLDMLVSGTAYNSGGQRLFFPEFADPATNNGFTDNTDYDHAHSVYSSVGFGEFNLQFAHNERIKGIPTGAFDTVFNDPGTRTTDRRSYLNLNYNHGFSERTYATARLSYDTYEYAGDYILATGLNRDETSSARWSGELKLVTQPSDRHRLVLGTEYTDNAKQDQRNLDVSPVFFLNLDDRRKSTIRGVYAQDEFEISDRWHLSAGLRHDRYSTLGNSTNPRLALLYNPTKDAVLKLMYGKAFRPPNVYELYYNDGNVTQKANPGLRPETIKTYEAAWEQTLANSLRLTVSGFLYKARDLITLTTDPADGLLVYDNAPEVRVKGVELGAQRKWGNGIEGRAGFTVQEAEDTGTGQRLSNSPRQLVKLNLLWPLLGDRLTAGAEAQYTGPRTTAAGSEVGGFWLANLTLLSRKLAKGMELSASVYNLFDRRYLDPVSTFLPEQAIQQDGRNFRAKLDYRF
jgi:outer membrane receptor protein involved in Fe transport